MGSNFGFRKIFKWDEQNMKVLNDTLKVLWDKLLGNVDYKDFSSGAKRIIDSKASQTAVDEVSGKVITLSTEVAQTQEEILLRATKKELEAVQAEVKVQADEISLTVSAAQNTANSAATAAANAQNTADDKLGKKEAAVGVNTHNGIVINQNGVYVEGKEIDLRTSDGDEYVHISEAGVSASSITAPNVAAKYDKWEYMVVSHDESEQHYTNVFRSLQEVFDHLNGRVVDKPVVIGLAFSDKEYGDVSLDGVVLLKDLTISANAGFTPTIVGQLNIDRCNGMVFVNDVRFELVGDKHGISSGGPVFLQAERCVFAGNGNGYGYGLIKYRGGEAYVYNCEFYSCFRAVVSRSNAHTTMIECKGNCKINADRGGVIYTCGYMPDSSTTFAPEQSWGGKVYTDNTYVDQGSGGGSSVPVLTTATYTATSTGSYRGSGSKYRNDVAQGWYDSIGRIRGCMWFDNNTIRSAMRGKTVLSATIRLAMRSNVGRGTSVTVELSGTYSNSGASSAAVTKTYGTLGTANPGETVSFALPIAAVTDLVNGTINGLMLYSSDTGAYKERDYSKNYAVFDGAADATPPQLTVIYQ